MVYVCVVTCCPCDLLSFLYGVMYTTRTKDGGAHRTVRDVTHNTTIDLNEPYEYINTL